MKKALKKVVPNKIINFYHYVLAITGAFLYGFPSRKMTVVGITGTSGKTTVADMIDIILNEFGYKSALLSSIKFKIGEKEEENMLKVTMPGRMRIQKFLKQAKKEKVEYAILEVTSEGIKQHRQKLIDFDVAILTNLSPEHIESHGGFGKYRQAKAKFFKETKNLHIINFDDENRDYFLNISSKEKICYGIEIEEEKKKIFQDQKIKFIEAKDLKLSSQGIDFKVNNFSFHLNLFGRFNVYNALAAISFAISQDIPLEVIKKALEKIKGVPGRMEIVAKEPITVVVDYAHTPVALENVYRTIKGFSPTKMICVLGSCGGGRDKWKRPVLGKLAIKYCDEVIITNEDPYDEDPMEIINQVGEGAGEKAKKILDRRQAINKAIKLAKKGDVVVITGKGSEPWLCVRNGKKVPWDDRQIAREELEKIIN